ncbi:MAG: DUF4328 domain-containing protein [Ilumatobacter sp.]
MSDEQLPPPPPQVPATPPPPTPSPLPPPPPPPGLTAPPGYVAYNNAPTPTGRLKRIGGLARWATITTAFAGVLSVVSSIVLAPVVGKASDFLAGEISEDEFNDAYLSSQLLSTLQTVVGLAAGVVTIIWLYRIAANVRVYSRRTTFNPVFAILGWILPPFLYVLPLLVIRELWKASDPDIAVGDEGWRSSKVNPLLYVWFVIYGVIPAILTAFVTVATFESVFDGGLTDGGSARLTAEALESSGQFTVASGLVTLVAAVVWVILVKQLTARHVALTGED